MLDKSECMNNNIGTWASGTPDMGHAPVLSPHSSFYIDGYNLYFSLLEFCQDWTIVNGRKHKHNKNCDIKLCPASPYKWINVRMFCEKIALNHRIRNIADVNLFTTTPDTQSINYDRHCIFQKVQSFYGSQIINGRFSHKKEEKETDINLVIKVIEDITYHNINTIFLVTNDSDFVPLIHFIKRHFPKIKIFLYTPPNRATVRFLKETMCEYYNKNIIDLNRKKVDNRDIGIYQISSKLMLQCKLPNSITLQDGTIITNPYIRSNE